MSRTEVFGYQPTGPSRRRWSARIDQVVLVAGGDDQVWPALAMAESISARREEHGSDTVLVADPDVGHRTVLPAEPTPPTADRVLPLAAPQEAAPAPLSVSR